MTSLQNHLRQLSGNKQNKKVAFKEGDFFFIPNFRNTII